MQYRITNSTRVPQRAPWSDTRNDQ